MWKKWLTSKNVSFLFIWSVQILTENISTKPQSSIFPNHLFHKVNFFSQSRRHPGHSVNICWMNGWILVFPRPTWTTCLIEPITMGFTDSASSFLSKISSIPQRPESSNSPSSKGMECPSKFGFSYKIQLRIKHNKTIGQSS